MAARRKLVEGVTPAPELEREFVHSGKVKTEPSPTAEPTAEASAPREAKANAATVVGRSPFTTRLRTDFSEALKRASLERQLAKVQPNTLQDILEEALEPWLRKHGYIP